MQYGWRSLEATVRIRLKRRGKRLKSKTWECQKTPDPREHSLTRAHPKVFISTLKPSSTKEPTSSRASYTTLILQQHRNIALSKQKSIKYTGCPKSHQTHWHLKTHYWALHFTPEWRDPAPPTRTLMQAALIRKPWLATHPIQPTGRNLHNKEEPQTFSIQEGHPKHRNLNKVKRQRNIQ